MFHLYFLAENVGFRQKSVNFAVEKIEITVINIKKDKNYDDYFYFGFRSSNVFRYGILHGHVLEACSKFHPRGYQYQPSFLLEQIRIGIYRNKISYREI